jgi:hypothetical protein
MAWPQQQLRPGVSATKQPTPPLPLSLLAAGSLAGVAFFAAAGAGGGGSGRGGASGGADGARSPRGAGGAEPSAGGGGGGGGGVHEKTNQVRARCNAMRHEAPLLAAHWPAALWPRADVVAGLS